MNAELFLWLYNIAHSSPWVSTVVIWFARSAQYVMIGCCLAFLVIELQHHKKVLREATVIGITSIGAWAIAGIIKIITQVPRPFVAMPYLDPLFVYGGYNSFPSGHAATFFALATSVYFYSKRWGIIFYIGAVGIAIARVMAGVHFPVDILVGALIGCLVAYFVHTFFWKNKKLFPKRNK